VTDADIEDICAYLCLIKKQREEVIQPKKEIEREKERLPNTNLTCCLKNHGAI